MRKAWIALMLITLSLIAMILLTTACGRIIEVQFVYDDAAAGMAGEGDRSAMEQPDTEAAPVTEAPTTEAAPVTEAPATEAPATEAGATEAPKTEAPTTEAPKTTVPNAKTGNP